LGQFGCLEHDWLIYFQMSYSLICNFPQCLNISFSYDSTLYECLHVFILFMTWTNFSFWKFWDDLIENQRWFYLLLGFVFAHLPRYFDFSSGIISSFYWLAVGHKLCIDFSVPLPANFLTTLRSHMDVICSCYFWFSLRMNVVYSYSCSFS